VGKPEEDNLEDLVVDVSIILEWIFESGMGGMDWIDLAQDRARRRAFVNAVMNLKVS
jgi:hypothetical protein